MAQKIELMVMAGTKDAAKIIEKLKSCEKFRVMATTTTEYGAEKAKTAGACEVLIGQLDVKDLTHLIKKRKIEVLVDATHPFATSATKNAIKASEITGIQYIRFERPKEVLIENIDIHKVFSFEEAALKVLEVTEDNAKILHLAGVSTLNHITNKIDQNRIFARVLPSIDSIERCLDLGLKQENIIAMQGTFSKNFNKALMKEYEINAIITKESGKTGGTLSKISAAMELEIEIILVTRPKIPELQNKDVFTDLNEMINFISNN
ncbi:MAG: precorrin-6A reductase [Methanobacterium sp.]